MFLRIILFSTLILICGGAAMAQKPGPEFWRRVTCEPFESRTLLEEFEDRHGSVIIKGFTQITTVDVRGVRIDVVEMRDLGNTKGLHEAKGLVIGLRGSGERQNENRAYVDYREIDSLLNALDVIARVD